MAEIFISYTSRDRAWAHWIAHEVEAIGHAARVHEWEIAGGNDIVAWTEEQLGKADHILCVVSKGYLEAPYSSWERRSGQWAAQTERPGFVLPVLIEDCRLPVLLAPIKRCDLYGITDAAKASARLREFLAVPAKPARGPFPGAPARPAAARPPPRYPGVALSNIAIAVPRHFLGRAAALAQIRRALTEVTGRPAVAALHGLRGVGKTTLAAAYAEQQRGAYRATWWIPARSEPTMRASLVALGVRLGWVGADDQEGPALAAVAERLSHEGDGILLIYDNAEDARSIEPHLPRRGAAHVLITSNAPHWHGIAEPIALPTWPDSIGADYLIAGTGRTTERAAAEALSRALGGLPLAHAQAAAYCDRLGLSLADYHRRFDAAPLRLLDAAADAPGSYDRRTVAKTFGLAIDAAGKRHAGAAPLIAHAALLPPEPIPLFLFAEGREMLGEPLATALADDGLDEAVGALRAFALIDREPIVDERDPAISTDTLRLHRLVREVAAARLTAGARDEAMLALLRALGAVYPRDVDDDPRTWPRARRLHLLALTLVDSTVASAPDDERIMSWLLDRVAAYQQFVLATYAQARPLAERALAIEEKILGPDDPDTATRLNNLALLLRAQGDLAGARALLERALAIREKALEPEHPDTAISLNNLALVLQAQGDLATARALYERALTIREKVLGPEHSGMAISLNNLAFVLQRQGDLAAARSLNERALAIREKALGAEHPDTAVSLNNLALVLQAQGDLATARALYERALAIREKVLGPEHPDTAISLNNLAFVLRDQGDLAAARSLNERALAILEKVLGPEHPDTASSLNNLALVLRAQGDLATAQSLHERALAIREKVLGPEHPDTASSLNNLALVLQDQGDLTAARPLYERALAIREKILGPEHPDTAKSVNNLAVLLKELGQH
jgi:tetratricopeptide (TPR) repeat protein